MTNSKNIDAADTIQSKLASANAIVDLLISNYQVSTVNDGRFYNRQGTIHEAHAALSDLLEAAHDAAKRMDFEGIKK